MPKINIRKFIYTVRHSYLTLNNIVIAAAFVIAAGWVWGSLDGMQRNFALQREVDLKQRQLQLAELEKESLELQQNYYKTDEYQEIAARESLGLVMPGERVLILPPNSEAAKQPDAPKGQAVRAQEQSSNLEQWLNFLFGGYSKTINGSD